MRKGSGAHAPSGSAVTIGIIRASLPPRAPMSDSKPDWLDATKTAEEALDLARKAMASERANLHITMLMLATLARTAPKEAVDKLHAEFERIRDMSGPSGAVANEIFATALSTLERYSPPE